MRTPPLEIMLKNYENFCNTLNRTIKAAETNHYKEAVAENNNNSSDLWKIINEIENFKAKKKTIQKELYSEIGDSRDP